MKISAILLKANIKRIQEASAILFQNVARKMEDVVCLDRDFPETTSGSLFIF